MKLEINTCPLSFNGAYNLDQLPSFKNGVILLSTATVKLRDVPINSFSSLSKFTGSIIGAEPITERYPMTNIHAALKIPQLI